MKAFKSKGEWLHKGSGRTFNMEYVIVCDDNADPIQVIKDQNDMTGMDYLRGTIEPMNIPFAIDTSCYLATAE